jgi:peptidyl-dipeptidase A
MKPDYAAHGRDRQCRRQGTRLQDIADMWLANYDMPSEGHGKDGRALWTQVQPLYNDLHCYTRGKLNAKYGDAVQPKTGPIRADLLGNMWAQHWNGIYDIVAPPASNPGYRPQQGSRRQEIRSHQDGEDGRSLLHRLGLAPAARNLLGALADHAPADREVICHASAWDVDNQDDIRIKMCTQVNAEDFSTVHHELGHNFYQRAYNKQDLLFKNGANDGFHEAIGDFVALSITPEYLKQLGLITSKSRRLRRRHRPADGPRAREGRLPALRPQGRQMALAGLPRRDARRVQPGMG